MIFSVRLYPGWEVNQVDYFNLAFNWVLFDHINHLIDVLQPWIYLNPSELGVHCRKKISLLRLIVYSRIFEMHLSCFEIPSTSRTFRMLRRCLVHLTTYREILMTRSWLIVTGHRTCRNIWTAIFTLTFWSASKTSPTKWQSHTAILMKATDTVCWFRIQLQPKTLPAILMSSRLGYWVSVDFSTLFPNGCSLARIKLSRHSIQGMRCPSSICFSTSLMVGPNS